MISWSTHHTALWIRGRDRAAWLNGLVTCDVAKLRVGAAIYGLLLEKKGRIVSDLWVASTADALVMVLPKSTAAGVHQSLDHHLIMEDVELSLDETAKIAFVEGAVPAMEGAVFAGAYPLIPSERDGLIVADASASSTDLVGTVSAEHWDARRIVRGVPRFGVDFDTAHYPQEASLERVGVAFDKGCYLGQEVIYMLENRGKARQRLLALDVVGPEAISAGTSVTNAAGEAIGEVTSATANDAGRVCAIARLKSSAAPEGAEVHVGGRTAIVAELGVHKKMA